MSGNRIFYQKEFYITYQKNNYVPILPISAQSNIHTFETNILGGVDHHYRLNEMETVIVIDYRRLIKHLAKFSNEVMYLHSYRLSFKPDTCMPKHII